LSRGRYRLKGNQKKKKIRNIRWLQHFYSLTSIKRKISRGGIGQYHLGLFVVPCGRTKKNAESAEGARGGRGGLKKKGKKSCFAERDSVLLKMTAPRKRTASLAEPGLRGVRVFK